MDNKVVIARIESLQNPKNAAGMARFGIRPKTRVCGVAVPELRKMAKLIKKNHKLAQALWDSKIHEARILAGMIASPELLTSAQMEKWVKDFDSWDVCDQACMNLFSRTRLAGKKIFEWSEREEEFVKRTAFSLMAALAVHDKKSGDKFFIKFFSLIKKAATDERNFVKKAVNWALRQIGKRNKNLNKQAIKLAEQIGKMKSKSAKWVANNALTELTSKAVQKRLNEKYF